MVALLPTGKATLDAVARSHGRTVRTLQREIEAEGKLYSDIVAEARESLALGYLQDRTLSIAGTADLLGYSCSAAFIRWFRGRFGTTPRRWRHKAFTASVGP